MFNSIVLATAKEFTQGTEDKNGLMPVMLNVLAGKAPNRNVISGTVADNEGIEKGKTYLIQVRETAKDEEFGRQFVFSKVAEPSTLEIVQSLGTLGEAQIFNIDSDDSTETEPEEIVVADETK